MALFPIPDVVAFPGNDLPLHVFEPRYRKLVHDCVEHNRMIGVCHTVKAISTPTKKQSIEEALASNQTTYKPHQVFSAGHCEILETTADGRIIANVRMTQRLQLETELQSLPYRIVSCTPLNDLLSSPGNEHSDHDHAQTLQTLIHQKLVALVETETNSENPLLDELKSSVWTSLTPYDYSFRVFRFVRFEADIMQSILESQTVGARLDLLWELLSS